MKVSYPLPGGGTVETEIENFDQMYLLQLRLGVLDDPKDAFKAATAGRRGLPIPDVCPLDGTPVQLNHRSSKGYDFYEVMNTPASTDEPRFKLQLGQYKDGDGLFVKEGEGWLYYDRDAKEECCAFQYGHFIPDGFPPGWEPPEEQRALYPDGEYKRSSDRDSEPESRPNRSRGSGQREGSRPSRSAGGSAASSGDKAALAGAQNFIAKVGKELEIPADRIAAVVGNHFGKEWHGMKDVDVELARELRESMKNDRDTMSELLVQMHDNMDANGAFGADDIDDDHPF